MPIVLAHLVACAQQGALTGCVAGPPGAGKTGLFVQILQLWVVAEAGTLAYVSHSNSTLIGMCKALADSVPEDAPGLRAVARFPGQDSPPSPLDIGPKQRAAFFGGVRVAIVTADIARRDGAGTMLRNWATMTIVDEAQQAVWMEDIMACGVGKERTLEAHTGDPQQPRGPASTEAQKAYSQLAKAIIFPCLLSPYVDLEPEEIWAKTLAASLDTDVQGDTLRDLGLSALQAVLARSSWPMTVAQSLALSPRPSPDLQLTTAYRLVPAMAALIGILHAPWASRASSGDPFAFASSAFSGAHNERQRGPAYWIDVPQNRLPRHDGSEVSTYRRAFIPVVVAYLAALLAAEGDELLPTCRPSTVAGDGKPLGWIPYQQR